MRLRRFRKQSGSAGSSMKNWIHFKEMEFLNDVLSADASVTNIDSDAVSLSTYFEALV